MNARNSLASACAIAVLFTLASAVSAKQPDTTRGAAVAPIINASEDYPVTYPGGTPPAPLFGGALDADDSTYTRQLAACGGLSSVGVGVRYDTITLTNAGASTASVNLAIECGAGDGFLTAYSAFDPAAPGANCLASNDDTVGLCPALTGVSIAPGATVVFVVSEYEPGDMNAWSAVFTGTTPVSLQNFTVD